MGFVASARVTEAADTGGWFLLGCPPCATSRAAGWLIASGRLRLRDVCVYVCVFVFVFVHVPSMSRRRLRAGPRRVRSPRDKQVKTE